MPNLKPKEIMLKAPFKRISPDVAYANWGGYGTTGEQMQFSHSSAMYKIVSQDDFIREYDPSGHKIWDRRYLMDRKKSNDAGETFIHFVERVAIPLQSVITTKQLTHLCGNPIQFTNSNQKATETQETLMSEFKQGWIKKNMEERIFEAAKAEKITGDSAICGYVSGGVFGTKVFSWLNDEILYPHYDNITGKLDAFGREYRTYKKDSMTVSKEYLDVWDETYLTTYERSNTTATKIIETLGFDGWSIVSRSEHGFGFVPIAYKRSSIGACWSLVQDLIDKYELAVSNLCENNKAYAFRILFMKGDDVGISKFDSTGAPQVITGNKDTDAKLLERADASPSFELQLNILLKNIFTGSFVVLPPEVKGGDLPGVTIKLLYSPAVEKAMEDAKEWNGFIDDLVAIFKHGYGIEVQKTTQYEALDIRGEFKPYVHQNEQEIIQNINTSVLDKSLSFKTASEIHPYARNNEYVRLTDEAEKAALLEAKGDQEEGETAALNETNMQRQQTAQ